jgi:hypothetical protein
MFTVREGAERALEAVKDEDDRLAYYTPKKRSVWSPRSGYLQRPPASLARDVDRARALDERS